MMVLKYDYFYHWYIMFCNTDVVVSFEQDTLSVREGERIIQVCCILFTQEDTERDLIVMYNSNDVTGMRFTLCSMVIIHATTISSQIW